MIRFQCRSCQVQLWLSQVGVWLEGEPFCNATCTEKIDQDNLREKTPTAAEHIVALPDLLIDVGNHVQSLIEFTDALVQREQSLQSTSATTDLVGKFSLIGAVVGGITESNMSAELAHFRGQLWDQFAHLDVLLKDVVRRSMALHAAGYGMANGLSEAIQTSEQLDADGVHAAGALLRGMLTNLGESHVDVQQWT